MELIMQIIGGLLILGIVVFLGVYLVWALVRVYHLSDEMEMLIARQMSDRIDVRLAISNNRIVASSLKKLVNEVAKDRTKTKRLGDAVACIRNNSEKAQNKATAAWRQAKQNEAEFLRVSKEFDQVDECMNSMMSDQKEQADSFQMKTRNMNNGLNEMLGELGRQGQAIHALKVGKANKVTPPANKSPRAKKAGARA